MDDAKSYLEDRNLKAFHYTQPQSSSLQEKAEHPNGVEPTILGNGHARRQAKLLVWSAAEETCVKSLGRTLLDVVKANPNSLDDVAYTLAVRRTLFPWRAFAVVDQQTTLVMPSTPVKQTQDPKVVFVFTGQGAQYYGMGKTLADTYPEYLRSLEHSDEILRDLGSPWSALKLLVGNSTQVDGFSIDDPALSQPLCTCVQIGLVDLLGSLKINPSAVIGHSSGEIAAAYAAGAINHATAIKIAYHRGRLASAYARTAPNMAMAAVGLSEGDVRPFLDEANKLLDPPAVTIGCINSPRSVTLTGDRQLLDQILGQLEAKGVFNRRLPVPVAYHSPYMQAMADEYAEAMGKLSAADSCALNIPMISSVTQGVEKREVLQDVKYWVQNLVSPVRFQGALMSLLAQFSKTSRKRLGSHTQTMFEATHLLEIGPHSALQGPIRDCIAASSIASTPTYIGTLSKKSDAAVAFLTCVGQLYTAGFPVDIIGANNQNMMVRATPQLLPKYPFNHDRIYWPEGRLSRNFRFPKYPRDELIGSRCLDWNPYMATWRNVIRLQEVPWLEDHRVGNQILLPAAGMLVMATQAFKQVHGELFPIQGLQFREVNFKYPIRYQNGSDTVEIQLTLTSHNHINNHEEWSEFRLFVLQNDEYIDSCSGQIRAVTVEMDPGQLQRVTSFTRGELLEDWFNRHNEACVQQVDDPYNAATGTVVQYGPAFRNSELLRRSSYGQATSRIRTRSSDIYKDKCHQQEYQVHPTTLDAMIQLVVHALATSNNQAPTMLPSSIKELWISGHNLETGQHLTALTSCSFRGYRGADASIVLTTEGDWQPLVICSKLETTFIDQLEDSRGVSETSRRLCTRLQWKPDVLSLSQADLEAECIRGRPSEGPNAVTFRRELNKALFCFIYEATEYFDKVDPESLPRHLQKYAQWARYQLQRLANGDFLPATSDQVKALLHAQSARNELNSRLEESTAEGLFYIQVGRALLDIVKGNVSALDIMFRSGLADQHYEAMLGSPYHSHPAMRYAELLSFKNSAMRILEVGAGTGGQTLRLLESMSMDGVKKWAQYDYTDISPGFFGRAQEKFAAYQDNMSFRVLDISKDPESQTFCNGGYDLVVASHVLHATVDLNQSLRHIRKLLKPDGKLLLFETTEPQTLQIGFAFGLLSDWWAPLDQEERSKFSPCLSTADWDSRLKATGFSGLDSSFHGQEAAECRYSSIMISSAVETSSIGARPKPDKVVLVQHSKLPQMHESISEDVLKELARSSIDHESETLAHLASRADLADSTLVFLLDIGATFLATMNPAEYADLHTVLLRHKSILWVSRSIKNAKPQLHLVEGLLRALSSEDPKRMFVTLHADERAQNIAGSIISILNEMRTQEPSLIERDYVLENDTLDICRIVDFSAMDEIVAAKTNPYPGCPPIDQMNVFGSFALQRTEQSIKPRKPNNRSIPL